MARKKLKQPSDVNTSDERKKIKERPHFDFNCDVFAEEHYGSYLIVRNAARADRSRKYNRFYLDAKKELEFLLKTGYGPRGITSKNHKINDRHLFTMFPTYKTLIQTLISKIKRNEKRNTVRDLSYGINIMISLFKELDKNIPEDPCDFNAEIHQKCLLDAILEGKVTLNSHIRYLGAVWAYIRTAFDNSVLGILPSQSSVETQMEQLVLQESKDDQVFDEKEGKDEITLEMLFQLDYYSQMELDRIIGKVKEYQQWMKELDMHGELFSRANLLNMYYNNRNSQMARNLYILLYKEDPQCWNPNKQHSVTIDGKRNFSKVYNSESDEKRHKKLIAISEMGIDISIINEKMFAWWHKTLFPNWPFVKTVVEPYDTVFTSSDSWLTHQIKAAGILVNDFQERIFPNQNTLYPLYLKLLIDTTANTDTVSNIRVYKKVDGTYGMGAIHANLRMLDSVKGRSNTVPPSFIAKGTFIDQCVDFFIEWLAPVYEHSDSTYFLQYIGSGSKIIQLNSDSVKTLNPQKKNNSKGWGFFEKHEIYKSVEKAISTKEGDDDGVLDKERVWWIKHMNIRAANNFKNYHLLYGEWVRAHVTMGQQNDQTEKLNYRKFSWKLGDEHQTAVSMLHIQKFIEGKIVDEKLENVFNQPHCGCKDNTNPTFEGAPKINDGEVCTSWRYCLTRCDNSYVFPKEHAPTIMAWQIVMEQEYESGRIIRLEDWEKEYGEDYKATEVVISTLKPKDKEFAKSKAAERIPFVRLIMMQTKQKRKLNDTMKEALNG